MKSHLDEIIGHLGAARTQRASTDDKIIAEHIDDAYEAAMAMTSEIEIMRRRIRELEYEARGGWSRAKELEGALAKIRDASIPDQPTSSPGDELSWARLHVSNLRRIASSVNLNT